MVGRVVGHSGSYGEFLNHCKSLVGPKYIDPSLPSGACGLLWFSYALGLYCSIMENTANTLCDTTILF